MSSHVFAALGICLAGVLLEALCAGTGVRSYMRRLNWPSFSPPLWMWGIIGAAYYLIVFVCAYRLLGRPASVPMRQSALTFLILIVILNAIWNLLFFRAKKLGATFAFSLGYSVVVVACVYCLTRVDKWSAWALGLYSVYLVYANIWSYRLWRAEQLQA